MTYFNRYNRLWVHPPHWNWLKCVPFYGWVIFHCIYVPQLLYPFICRWTSRLFPCPSYCKYCCNEHGGTCLFRLWFPKDICLVVGLLTGRWHMHAAAAAAKSLQSWLTLCDPIDGSPPGSAIPGILQARTLEWAAISFSNAWKWKLKVKSQSRDQLFMTPWTAAHQAPPSMGFSRQEYWSGVPLPSPDICIPMDNSCWCMAEINTIL